MSNKDYVGYTLFDKVIIVAKNIVEEYRWSGDSYEVIFGDRWQGYVVDPSNKSMLKSALDWGIQYKSIYKDGKYVGRKEVPPQQFEFDNRDWTLELLQVADGSSQGGKLSFWNCKLMKGDQTFEIGINADLLLDVLKSHTFHNGRCVGSLMFARCKGGVGLLSEDMEEYKQALADMQKKKDVKSKKTSKHVVGHAYTALKEANAYAGDVYAWYEPITVMEKFGNGLWSREEPKVVGFRKLAEPKKYKWFPTLYKYEPGKMTALSESRYFQFSYNLRTSLPARIDAGPAIKYDITLAEAIDRYYWQDLIKEMQKRQRVGFYSTEPQFYSASATEPYFPEEARKLLIASGYRIED